MAFGVLGGLVALVLLQAYAQSRSEKRLRAVEIKLQKLMRHAGFEPDAEVPVVEDAPTRDPAGGGTPPSG